MPVRERFARSPKAVSAGGWKPIETVEVLAIKPNAIRDALLPMFVIEATAVAPIEQFARDIGRIEEPGLFIFQLVHAATTAAVAQRLPLAAVERRKGLFPKGRCAVHLKSSLALLGGYDQAGLQGLRL